jgi:uncharacterized protein
VEHYRSYRKFVRQRFGRPVLTIPVNAGFSCPNRDGAISASGCAFCDNRSFSRVWDNTSPVISQIEKAIEGANNKFDAFIVYLQPFSNTYGSIERLSQLYEAIISYPRIVGLAIGTRPDCFSEAIYKYLHDISRRTYLSVEVGLQSAHDETLMLCHRGHSVENFRQCVRSLSERGISTVAHVILGLPSETEQMMMETAQELARLPVTGIKIHQLMIIAETLAHRWYAQGKIECLTLDRYAQILAGFLSYLRPDQYIHRIVANSRIETGLVAPLWSAQKLETLNYINDYMDKKKMTQGMLWRQDKKNND